MDPRPFVPPTYGTEPTDRPNRAATMADIAEMLGTPYMPHQRLIAEVGSEYDPATGEPAYGEVICSMHRRGGKTIDVLVFMLERCLLRSTPQRVVYSAQTGQDGRKKILGVDAEDRDAFVPMLEASPLLHSSVAKVRRNVGAEGINFHTGSHIDNQAASAAAGHGFTTHLAIIDEAWADEDARREGALTPSQLTIPDAQLHIRSTMGDERSLYLDRKVEVGRQAVSAGSTAGIAYFEWSFPDDADLDDEDVWWDTMPALGRTIRPEGVRRMRLSMDDDEFLRAVGNRKAATGRVIPAALWAAAVSPTAEPADGGRLAIGIDASPLGTSASIAVSDQFGQVELVDHQPGMRWVADRARYLSEKYQAPVVVDSLGALAGLDGDHITKLDTSHATLFTADVFERIVDGHIKVRQHEALDAAVEAAGRRHVGDRWLWSRRSAIDISPLVAMTWAVGFATLPVEEAEEAFPPFAFG